MAAANLKLVSLRELGLRRHVERALLPTGISEVDGLIEGFPRGAISEIVGETGSGRTSLVLVVLAAATSRGEVCAYIDVQGSFDPMAAAVDGAELNKLIWVRCGGDCGAALKSTGEILSAGGFGTVVLDLGGVARKDLRKIPSSYWYRFRLAIEHTETILLLLGREPSARNCAELQLKVRPVRREWAHRRGSSQTTGLFRGLSFELLLAKSQVSRSLTVKGTGGDDEDTVVITARPRMV
jgi:hypothetical protein